MGWSWSDWTSSSIILSLKRTAPRRIIILKKITNRDEQIYKLKNDGHTFVHIGESFNISRARVQAIHAEVKYIKEEFPKLPPFEQALSPRSKNALMGYYKDRKIFTNSEIIANAGRKKIFSIKNIGRKNLKEIAEALYKTGYIDYDDPWLDDYRDKRIKMYYISPERPTNDEIFKNNHDTSEGKTLTIRI